MFSKSKNGPKSKTSTFLRATTVCVKNIAHDRYKNIKKIAAFENLFQTFSHMTLKVHVVALKIKKFEKQVSKISKK